MKAVVSRKYESPVRLQLEEVATPEPAADEMLLRVHAASVNALDWRVASGLPVIVRGSTGLSRPKRAVRGVDVSGVLEAVGPAVTGFKEGDAVFGVASGSFAEYASADPSEVILKPETLGFEEAAALPVAGCTALQALRKVGNLQSGQSVLVNGAAGGVGTFTVQIAKAMGAEVAGVCGTRNVDMVGSLGATDVVDYSKEDFCRRGRRYDLIVDVVGNRSISDLRRALAPQGTLVLAGGGDGKVIGPIAQMLRGVTLSLVVKQNLRTFIAKVDHESLAYLAELYGTGGLTPAIDRRYSLPETPEVVSLLETHHARGKSVIVVQS